MSETKLLLQVREFHRLANAPILYAPELPSCERLRLRQRLLNEETLEFAVAAGAPRWLVWIASKVLALATLLTSRGRADLVQMVDGLCDVEYITKGSFIECGVSDVPCLDEVHSSNLSKFPTVTRSDGKVMKPKHYRKPDLGRVLCEQGWRP